MNTAQSPFPPAWWSFDLGKHRPCDGTYCFYPYDSIPPLDESLLQGNFQWLGNLDESLQTTMSLYERPEAQTKIAARLKNLLVEAARLQLKLPDPFLKFMGSPTLPDQIPSCTACYFDLSDHIIQLPIEDGCYLIRFLNDQQEVLLWYLYLTPESEHCVLVSPISFDDEELAAIPPDVIRQNTFFCAPTFETFLYRFWLENKIWFALDEKEALTDAQRRYLEHYKSR